LLQALLFQNFPHYNDYMMILPQPLLPSSHYIDPPYIYTYGLHFKGGKWLQKNETRSQIHGSTTIKKLIKAMEVT
jgi:hypothetical protein